MINSADLRYAVRLLRKSQWFTLLTVLVLAGGLGVGVYTFAALNTLIYRSLPLADGDSIVRIGAGGWPAIQPLDTYELAEIRSQSATLREVGGYRAYWALVGEGASRLSVRAVDSDWRIFEFSRMPPLLGRAFTQEDSASGEPVAVLAYATWQSVFSGDAAAVGKLVRINGRLARIVGVMPQGYAFPINSGIWLPLNAAQLDPPTYSGKALDGYARLSPGSTVGAAKTELATLLQRLRLQRRDADDHKTSAASVLSFPNASWGALGTLVFGVLNLLSLSILLLAAVNVGNLLLARTNARMTEIGIRIALGAPRVRLILQMAIENIVLCACGGALAVFLAARALAATDSFVHALLGETLPFWLTWGLDAEAVAVAAVLLLLTVVAVSVLPALAVSRADPNTLLKDSARGSAGLSIGRISRALVTAQVALISTVMVVGSAVTTIAQRVTSIDLGMSPTGLQALSVELPAERYDSADKQLAAYARLLAELRASAGVNAAAVFQDRPDARVTLAGAEYANPGDRPSSWLVTLSESPQSIGPTLVEGRMFDSRDSATSSKTALVSRTFAQLHWRSESPLGRQLDISVGGAEPERRTVVGVLSDVRYGPLDGTSQAVTAVYVPLPQHVSLATRILVRFSGDEAAARKAMYAALERVDPQLAPSIMTYESMLDQVTLFARTITKVFAGAGAFAILMAIAGIYAMGSNAVLLRAQEIGLRRALGASNSSVVALFVVQSARQLIVGLALSAALSVAALFAMQRAFSVGTGALTLIGSCVVVVISTTVMLSIYVSVRSAVRLEPSATLRRG